jgi:hypothetical protein
VATPRAPYVDFIGPFAISGLNRLQVPQLHNDEHPAVDAASATMPFADIASYTALTEAHSESKSQRASKRSASAPVAEPRCRACCASGM